MTGDIQLPDMIDPDAPSLEFRLHQCRECREHGPMTLADNPAWWQWGDAHRAETGHRKFHQWTLSRHAGEVVTVNELRRPARRPLGKRETKHA